MARSSSLVSTFVALFLLPLTVLTASSVSGCGASSDTGAAASSLDVRFDPCQPLSLVLAAGATGDEAAGAASAAQLWNAAAGAQLQVTRASGEASRPSSPPQVPVTFEPAAAPSHGYFDPVAGQVLVNDDLSGHPLTVTIAHEIGHAFGLVHVSGRASVMNPGNLDVEPNAGDVAALSALWGRCGVTGAEP